MAWTDPKTWEAGDALTAAVLNVQVRDNLNALKDPPSAEYTCDEASNYTTTSTTFVDVDATNLALTINTNGGDVIIGFHGVVSVGVSGNSIYLDVYESVAADRLGGDDGMIYYRSSTTGGINFDQPISFVRLITGLSAGEHTFKLQWRVSAGTGTLFAGAGTTNKDTHPQFCAREVS